MNITRIAAAVTGLAAIALGIVSLSGPAVPDDHWGTRGAVVNALGLVTFLAMAVASGLLPSLLSLARVGQAGLRVAQVGLILMTVESAVSEAHGGSTLGPVFMLGLLLTVVGYVVLGVDGLRRPGARWLALLPAVAMLVGMGAAWCGLAALSASAVHDVDVQARPERRPV
jgi:hypothetical protein